MSKGYLGPGTLIMTWWDRTVVAFWAMIIMAIFGGIAWYANHLVDEDTQLNAAKVAAAPFRVGDMVKTKVGRFRGIVTYVNCHDGCDYWVRFDTATMEPQRMGSYEIEAAK